MHKMCKRYQKVTIKYFVSEEITPHEKCENESIHDENKDVAGKRLIKIRVYVTFSCKNIFIFFFFPRKSYKIDL